MINKFLIIFGLLLSASCEFKKSLKEPIYLHYADSDIVADITLNEKVVRHQEKPYYYYYGTLNFNVLSKASEKILFAVCNYKESKIYLDTIASVMDAWYYTNEASNASKKSKIYIVFQDQDIDCSAIKLITKNSPEKVSIEKACRLVSPGSDAANDCAKIPFKSR